MKKYLMMIALLLGIQALHAQDDVEYRMEFGGGGGLVSYQGDFNGKPFKNLQPIGSVVARYIFNPYMDLKMNASYGKLKGASNDVTTYYPDFQGTPYEFNHSLVDVGVVYEYNFWPYGTGRDYRGSKRIVPFLFGGLGGTFVKTAEKNVFTANLPIGVGVKYKISDRLNLGVEWSVHFSLSDELDGIKDPYGISSSGLFKNADGYSALQLTLTYSFMAKCRTCHNDND